MSADRREFLNRLAAGTAALGGLSLGLPFAVGEAAAAVLPAPGAGQGGWDTKWPDRLTGRVRSVFDVPEVESGFGVWRASIWRLQYEAALGIPVRECSTALVMRHNAIILAMTQAYWDRYEIGKEWGVRHPLTNEPTTRNPALLGESDGLGQPFAGFALPNFHAQGGVSLACDLALGAFIIPTIQKADAVSPEVARERALGFLVPGVILQPSGVFAVLLAQQMKQALYIRAS
jgi:hypothetical protein